MRRLPTRLPACCLAASLLATAGCSFFESPAQVRGNHVEADQLHELVPGTSTKADAVTMLGSPTTHASFDDNRWIYISQVTRPRIGQIQGVESQDVVVLTFNETGVLQKAEHLTQKDAEPVNVVARTTPSPGTSATFLQQLFGNIGKFNPLGAPSTGGLSTQQAPRF